MKFTGRRMSCRLALCAHQCTHMAAPDKQWEADEARTGRAAMAPTGSKASLLCTYFFNASIKAALTASWAMRHICLVWTIERPSSTLMIILPGLRWQCSSATWTDRLRGRPPLPRPSLSLSFPSGPAAICSALDALCVLAICERACTPVRASLAVSHHRPSAARHPGSCLLPLASCL